MEEDKLRCADFFKKKSNSVAKKFLIVLALKAFRKCVNDQG